MERSVRVEHPRFCTKSRMAMDEGEAGKRHFPCKLHRYRYIGSEGHGRGKGWS